jgi:hypothetical protein
VIRETVAQSPIPPRSGFGIRDGVSSSVVSLCATRAFRLDPEVAEDFEQRDGRPSMRTRAVQMKPSMLSYQPTDRSRSATTIAVQAKAGESRPRPGAVRAGPVSVSMGFC